MAIDPSSFWGTDIDLNSKLSPDLLSEAERIFGVKFPKELIGLWSIQNGGYTCGLVFPTVQRTSWADDHVPFPELFGVGPKNSPSGVHNIYNTGYMTREWDLPPNQVLLAGEGDWWITLDYRKSETPCVTWLDVDSGEDIELATSFKHFLTELLPAGSINEKTGRLAQ